MSSTKTPCFRQRLKRPHRPTRPRVKAQQQQHHEISAMTVRLAMAQGETATQPRSRCLERRPRRQLPRTSVERMSHSVLMITSTRPGSRATRKITQPSGPVVLPNQEVEGQDGATRQEKQMATDPEEEAPGVAQVEKSGFTTTGEDAGRRGPGSPAGRTPGSLAGSASWCPA